MTEQEQHAARVQQIARKVTEANERGERPVIYHGQSHSARPDDFADDTKIHVEQLQHVLAVDPDDQTITVEPDVSMRELVDATMEHGMIPYIVPEFPAITVGGAIQGGAGESSCFRYGLFGTEAKALEIVTGDGEIVTATPEDHSDLFYGQFGSYGSLGIVTKVQLPLLPATQYVDLTYRRVDGFEDAITMMHELSDRDDIHYLDAIMFSADHGVVMVGRRTNEKNHDVVRFSRPQDEWFYLHAQQVSQNHEQYTDTIPIKEYFFRYDIGSFWTLRGVFANLPIPFTKMTRGLLHPIMDTKTAYGALIHAGNFSSTMLLQDIITPVDETVDFLKWIDEEFSIYPLWLLPTAIDDEPKLSPSHLDAEFGVNVGIWGTPQTDVPIENAKQMLEDKATEIGARKTLYAHQFFSEDTFWSIYDKEWYDDLRKDYGAADAFPSVYENTVTEQLPEPSRTQAMKGLLSTLFNRS